MTELLDDKNPWYSHRHGLRQELDKLDKGRNTVVLEFGVGDGSSEVLHEYCSIYPMMKVVGFETNPIWFQDMKLKYALPNYTFNHIENWTNIVECLQSLGVYGADLTFVDQTPVEARMPAIDQLFKFSDKFILHDYPHYNMCNPPKEDIIPHELVVAGSWLYDTYTPNYELEWNIELRTLIFHPRI